MRTTKCGSTLFTHAGDFSGKIEIRGLEGETVLPTQDLIEFCAVYVREQRIAELEDQEAEQILGVDLPR